MTEERRQELRTILTRNALAQDWTRFLIDKLKANINKRRIGKTHALIRSFQREFKYSGGSISEISIKFLFYGRFVDMGVGSGLKAYERRMNKQNKSGSRVGANVSYNKRTPKRWLNKTTTAQTYKLIELLEEHLATTSIESIRQVIQSNVIVRI